MRSIQALAKSLFISLGLTAASSAADAGIHKNILGSGHNTTLIIRNDEMEDIFEYSAILLKGVSETIKNEAKEYAIRHIRGKSIRGKSKYNVLSNEPRFNGVYSRDNLPDKIKDWAYVINLDEYSDIETHSIALYVNTKTVI